MMFNLISMITVMIMFYPGKISTVFLPEGLLWTSNSNAVYIQNGTTSWIQNNSLPLTGFIKVGHSFQQYIGMSYDYRRQYVVFSDKGAKTISLTGKDNTGKIRGVFVHVGTSSHVGHVTVDWLSGNVYWSDSTFGWIGLQALAMTIHDIAFNDKFKVIVDKYLDIPSGVAVHPQKRFLFWSDIGKQPKIERSNLDGSSRMVLIWLGIIRPISLAVDHTNNALYWTDTVRGTVESCDFYGRNRNILVTSFTSQFYGIDIYKTYALVSDQARKEIKVFSTKKGYPVPDPAQTPKVPYSVSMYSSQSQPWSSGACNSTSCKDICITTLSGSKCMCEDGYKLDNDGLSCVADTHVLDKSYLIVNGSKVCALPITTINSHPYIAMTPNCEVASTGTKQINYIATDTFEKEFYFANAIDLHIYRQKLNGVPYVMYDATNIITGLSYDWTTAEIYWTEDNDRSIYKSHVASNITDKIDDSAKQVYLTNLDFPKSLTIDPLGRKLFWIAGSQNIIIQTANLNDTKNGATIVGTGLSSPYRLTYSRRMNRLFWTDSGKIGSVANDGTGIHITNLPNTFVYSGITTYKDYLMWLSKNSSGVFMNVEDRSDDKTDKLDVFMLPNMSRATEIQMFDNSIQPKIAEPCIHENGGCQHICIVEDYRSHCKCQFGYKLHSDGKSCVSEPLEKNFFIAIDEMASRIYQIDQGTGNTEAINIGKSSIPSAVTFDYDRRKIIWCDQNGAKLKISNLDGSEEKILTTAGINSYSKVAIDPATANIYFTKTNAIAVMSKDGSSQKQLVGGLDKASSITLHSKDGVMFWTEMGTNPSIKQTRMDGTSSVIVLVSKKENIQSPKDIAVDFTDNVLIWCDNILDKIERIDLTTHQTTHLRYNAKDYPVAIAVDSVYVYYIGNGQKTITRIERKDGKGATNILTSPLYGKLSSLFISQDVEIPKHNFCSVKNGFCSRLCLPKGKEKSCACPDGISLKEDGRTCVGDVICPSSVKNGKVGNNCLRYARDVCEYNCFEGYAINATHQQIICRSNGVWNVNTETLCIKILCKSDIQNGKVDDTCQKSFGDKCDYLCNNGYKRTEDKSTITCGSDEKWDVDETILCTVKTEPTALTSEVIIGIAAGSVVVVIVIVVIIIVCLINKVRKERKDNHNPPSVFFTQDLHPKSLSASQQSNTSYYSTTSINDDAESVYDEIRNNQVEQYDQIQSNRAKVNQIGSSKISDRYSVFPGNANQDYMDFENDTPHSEKRDNYLHLDLSNTNSGYSGRNDSLETPHGDQENVTTSDYITPTKRDTGYYPEPDYD